MNRHLLTDLYHKSVDYCVELGPNEDGTNRAWVWEEKFAELIIKECIVVAGMAQITNRPVDVAIKKHFGINL